VVAAMRLLFLHERISGLDNPVVSFSFRDASIGNAGIVWNAAAAAATTAAAVAAAAAAAAVISEFLPVRSLPRHSRFMFRVCARTKSSPRRCAHSRDTPVEPYARCVPSFITAGSLARWIY